MIIIIVIPYNHNGLYKIFLNMQSCISRSGHNRRQNLDKLLSDWKWHLQGSKA